MTWHTRQYECQPTMATHGYLDKLIVNNEQQEEHLRSTCVLFMCMFYKNNKNLIHIYFTFILLFLLSSSSSSPPPSSHCVHGYIYTIFGRGRGSSIIILLIYHITIHQHIDYTRGSCKQNDRGLPYLQPYWRRNHHHWRLRMIGRRSMWYTRRWWWFPSLRGPLVGSASP